MDVLKDEKERNIGHMRLAAALLILLAACGSGDGARRPPRAAQVHETPIAAQAVPGAELVRFASRDDDLTKTAPTTLDALVFRPQGAGPFASVVALHGCGGLFDAPGQVHARDLDWAQHLVGKGYAVVFPDSFGPRGVREVCHRGERTVHPGQERVRDAYGALVWIGAQPWARADRVALMGWSNGAIAALWTIAERQPARPKDLIEDFRQTLAFYPGCGKLLDSKWKPKAPLEMFVGELDDWTPAAACMQLVQRVRTEGSQAEIVVYRGAYHDFDAPNLPVQLKTGIGSTPSGKATVGTEPTARADAIRRADELLARALAL
jgi:dienelactone hydrolase